MSRSLSLLAAGAVAGGLLVPWFLARRGRTSWLGRRLRMWRQMPKSACNWPLKREAALAVELALRCGDAMVSSRGAAGSAALGGVSWKDAVDPVTQIDEDNEAMITKAVREAFPSHAVIGEEAAAAAAGLPPLPTDRPCWIVDPVDGTQNLVHGLPVSCVSIGLCVGGRPVLGVVFDPHRDELFIAADGCGSFLNGAPIRVAPGPPAAATAKEGAGGAVGAGGADDLGELASAMVLMDPGYERSPSGAARLAAAYEALLAANVRAVRILGSSVLCLAWVACGRASAFSAGLVEKDTPKPWDWAAGAVLVQEAGGVLASLEGRLHEVAAHSNGRGGGGGGGGGGDADGDGDGPGASGERGKEAGASSDGDGGAASAVAGSDGRLAFHVYCKGGIAANSPGLLVQLRSVLVEGWVMA